MRFRLGKEVRERRVSGGFMRIGPLNLVVRQSFIMQDALSAEKAKEFIEALLTGMEGGLVPLKRERWLLREQGS